MSDEYSGLGRDVLIQLIKDQKKTILELNNKLTSGIVLRGWWCMHCDTFNGEEKEIHTKCRRCECVKGESPSAVRITK